MKHRVPLVFSGAAEGRKLKWRTVRTGGKYQHVFSVPSPPSSCEIWDAITLTDEQKLTIDIFRSCPELDKDIGAGLADRTPTQFGNQDFPNIMEKNISRSAHSIQVGIFSIFQIPRSGCISKFQYSQD